jgi:hypothetical protein
MLTEGKKAGDLAFKGQPEKKCTGPSTLLQVGITRNESSDWQRLAAVPANRLRKAVSSPVRCDLRPGASDGSPCDRLIFTIAKTAVWVVRQPFTALLREYGCASVFLLTSFVFGKVVDDFFHVSASHATHL